MNNSADSAARITPSRSHTAKLTLEGLHGKGLSEKKHLTLQQCQDTPSQYASTVFDKGEDENQS